MKIPGSPTAGRLLVLVGLLALPLVLRAQDGAIALEVDYTPPAGYVATPEAGMLWMRPQAPGVNPPCLYALMEARPSTGSLEADAEEVLGETRTAGMERGAFRIARRGVAAAGWPYFLSGGNFTAQRPAGGYISLAVMVMVFPATANRVNVVFGLGDAAVCLFDDAPFAELFHGLRPRGWSSPAGNALERDLIGTWQGRTLSGHTFHADGRYAMSAAGVSLGNVVSAEPEGRYTLRGSEVTTTTRGGRAQERFRVFISDKWTNGRWQRTLTVLYDDPKPPRVADYVRVPK